MNAVLLAAFKDLTVWCQSTLRYVH